MREKAVLFSGYTFLFGKVLCGIVIRYLTVIPCTNRRTQLNIGGLMFSPRAQHRAQRALS